MNTEEQIHRVRALVAEELPALVELRHDLHRNPELGYEEFRTSQVITEKLGADDVAYVDSLAGGTGVLGHLPGGDGNPIALRADMDALPIHEETGVAHASRNEGRMHACGHDGHTTILLGTAKVLARLAQEHPLPRDVTFVFQPAEEGGAGGRRMCEEGALDGTRIGRPVHSIYGLHGHVETPVGMVSARVGPMLAAADELEITIRGRGGHAAMPHSCADPVLCAAALVQALQGLVSRETDPLDASVISITQLDAGDAFNVIPDEVRLGGTVRTLKAETRERLERRIEEVGTAIAAAHDCRAEVRFIKGYPVTRNHPECVDRFRERALDCLPAEQVQWLEHPVMGGEDFSFYGERVPACFFFLGLLAEGASSMPGLHNAGFDFNDDAIGPGIEVFCRLVLGA